MSQLQIELSLSKHSVIHCYEELHRPYQCIHNLALHLVLDILPPKNSKYLFMILLCQTMYYKNGEVQNSYLSYIQDLYHHHVVAPVCFSVEANQHALPLNILLINKFQVMIATHILWHANANYFDELHMHG
jgi:hypothetical protein